MHPPNPNSHHQHSQKKKNSEIEGSLNNTSCHFVTHSQVWGVLQILSWTAGNYLNIPSAVHLIIKGFFFFFAPMSPLINKHTQWMPMSRNCKHEVEFGIWQSWWVLHQLLFLLYFFGTNISQVCQAIYGKRVTFLIERASWWPEINFW